MNQKIEGKLKKIFETIFKDSQGSKWNLNTPRSEFANWDSLIHLQLVSGIEEAFGVSFEMDEIIDIEKPSDFTKLILKRSGNN